MGWIDPNPNLLPFQVNKNVSLGDKKLLTNTINQILSLKISQPQLTVKLWAFRNSRKTSDML